MEQAAWALARISAFNVGARHLVLSLGGREIVLETLRNHCDAVVIERNKDRTLEISACSRVYTSRPALQFTHPLRRTPTATHNTHTLYVGN